MKLSMDSVVARRDGTLFEEAGGELVAINLDNGAFYGMNAVACSIFKFIDATRRVAEIRDFLLETYEVDAAVCERQMLAVLEEMLAERLIVRDGGPGTAGPVAP
ncbi:PqqD family peptide modification chaperone [Amorphus sp. MBR-141]